MRKLSSKERKKEYDRLRNIKNKEIIKILKKKYYVNNCEERKEYSKTYRKSNPDKVKNMISIWRKNNPDKAKHNSSYWNKKNPDKYKSYRKKILDTDPVFKLKCNLRTSIGRSLKSKGFYKNNKTVNIIGCSFKAFKIYVESRWEPWMNWENHGKYNGELNYGWDLDHIIPLYEAKTEEDVIKLNHYTNFQPLCSKINRDIKKYNTKYYA